MYYIQRIRLRLEDISQYKPRNGCIPEFALASASGRSVGTALASTKRSVRSRNLKTTSPSHQDISHNMHSSSHCALFEARLSLQCEALNSRIGLPMQIRALIDWMLDSS